ncbi:MAG: DUF4381 domain-containing protein [Xanthomonadaceae bacterium]|nr:DUF4381 domain-containing protein [Xanthomonadaceae bacterium]
MQAAPEILLRDIHQPPSPSLWPPAPGWWVMFAMLLLVMAAVLAWRHHRRQRCIRIARLFDDAIAEAVDAPAEVMAISALLRRAARRDQAGADVIDGDEWLALLDQGMPSGSFQSDAGYLLLEGGYRRDIDQQLLAQLRTIARLRFLRWMGVAR